MSIMLFHVHHATTLAVAVGLTFWCVAIKMQSKQPVDRSPLTPSGTVQALTERLNSVP